MLFWFIDSDLNLDARKKEQREKKRMKKEVDELYLVKTSENHDCVDH